MREVAGVAIVEAGRAARNGERIALRVEHAEGVAVFEDERLQLRQRGGCGDAVGLARLRPLVIGVAPVVLSALYVHLACPGVMNARP
jgi:hypothetical protein